MLCQRWVPTAFASLHLFDFETHCPAARYDSYNTNDGEGVWYGVEATATEQLIASNCNSNYRVAVHVLSGTCDDLVCVASMSNDCTTTWNATEGLVYTILVSAMGQAQGGDFEIVVDTFEHIPNDRCDSSLPVLLDETVLGTTRGATEDGTFLWSVAGDNYLKLCDDFSSNGFGVWYKFETGSNLLNDVVTASSCYDGTDFGASRVDVYTGSSCDELTCISEDVIISYTSCNDKPFDEQAGWKVSWQTEENMEYYVYISGQGRDVGDYQLSLG